MNDLPRQKLVELVSKHGVGLIDDKSRAAGLFRDYFGEFRREIAVLTMALEENVAHDLNRAQNTPRAVRFARLTQRLCDNLALSESAAKWAVHSWALALGAISPQELAKIEQQNSSQTPATNAPNVQTAAPPNQTRATQNPARSAQTQTLPTIAPQNSTANQIVVSADGSGDFMTISEAIRAARDNQKIVVRAGLYRESLTLDKAVEIAGDHAAPQNTIVESVDSSCVKLIADKAAVRNLTLRCAAGAGGKQVFAVEITGAENILQNCDITSDSLACAAIHGARANPIIRDCRMRDGADSGVYFFDHAAGSMEECEVYQNKHAQIVIRENANPTIKNCRVFAGNDAGFYVYENGLGTIDDCDIRGHAAAEIVVSTGGSPVLRGCTIRDSASAGVFASNRASVLLENCRIYNNRDAGLRVDGASLAAANLCSINQNGAVAVGVKGASSVRVENSDLTGNLLGTWEIEDGTFVENNNNRQF